MSIHGHPYFQIDEKYVFTVITSMNYINVRQVRQPNLMQLAQLFERNQILQSFFLSKTLDFIIYFGVKNWVIHARIDYEIH